MDLLHWKLKTEVEPTNPDVLVDKLVSIVSKFNEAMPDESKLSKERPFAYKYPEVELSFISETGCFDDYSFCFGFKDSGMINVVKWGSFGGAGTVIKESGNLPLLWLTYLSVELEKMNVPMELRFSDNEGTEITLSSWTDLSEFLASQNENPEETRGWAIKLGLAKELFKFSESISSKPTAYF